MKNPRILLILAVVLFVAASSALVASAQGAATPKPIHIVAESSPESVNLNILFTIFDARGYPLPRQSLKLEPEGTVQLVGVDSSPVTATIAEATIPLKIALVLDASHSVTKEMPDVKDAAIEFVRKAPDNAKLAVYSFADDLDGNRDFIEKSSSDLIEGDIRAIITKPENTPKNPSDTCLYKAVRKAITKLNEQADTNPERRAVVLFTDGKDREAGGALCGDIQDEDVIKEALLSDPKHIPIQLYTIGLCRGDCSNVNRTALEKLSTSTFAVPAFGTVKDLGDAFETILSRLNSQWIATTNIQARQGENRADLSIKASINEGSAVPLGMSFSFTSNVTSATPTPAPMVALTSRGFDENENAYELNLHVTTPQDVGQITVQTWNSDDNFLVPPQIIVTNTITSEMKIPQPAAGFVENKTYCSQVKATTKNNEPIMTAEGTDLLVNECGPYHAKVFQITSAQIDWDNGTLDIALDNVRVTNKRLFYSGSVSEGNGLFSQPIEGELLKNQTLIQLPLTDTERVRLAKASGPIKYIISLTIGEDGKTNGLTNSAEFTIPRPLPPSLSDIIFGALTNPAVLGPIVIIVLIVAVLLIFLGFRRRTRAIPPPAVQTPAGHTVMFDYRLAPPPPAPPVRPTTGKLVASIPSMGAAASDATVMDTQRSVRIRVLETTDAAQIREQTVFIGHVPYVIGRDQNTQFRISGDTSLSRHHVELSLHGNTLVLRDCESRNGTVVADTLLPPGGSVELGRLTKVRLGRNTALEIES